MFFFAGVGCCGGYVLRRVVDVFLAEESLIGFGVVKGD